jgi:NADPH:quinone reductase-like Zn-dependent oxidoreductase
VNRLLRRPERRATDALVPLESLPPGSGFALEIGLPGHLDKVRYRAFARRAPRENEIELRIRSAGLNFKDVLKVLGLLDKTALDGTHYGDTLGMEACAVVTAVGPGVTGYRVGDEIVTLVAGCLASHLTVRTDQLLAVPRPSRMTAAEGATVPIAFMTAWYGLTEAARLRRGETVLIHAGAGGVGMAAIAVARWIGATIFATAGSREKRELLLGLGVARVWDSRSLEFVDGIREATGGRGVDVVLNSLSGEAMERSFEALAPLGLRPQRELHLA